MYSKFYGLSVDPFRLSPDHGFCLYHPSFTRAKAYMQFALQQEEGFVVVTGGPGTGKTTLIDELLAESGDSHFNFARLVSAQLDADDLLRMVGYAFSVQVGGLEKADLLHRLIEYFSKTLQEGRRSVLIVDEAQGLTRNALEELRLLTNFRAGDRSLLQILLVGQEELRELVTDPSLDQLNQRIVAACHMEPLKPRETVAYVLHRLKVAGWRHSPKLDSAIFPVLYRFSGGIPRRINRIFGRLLLHGFLEGQKALGAEDIELVVAELRAEHLSAVESSAIINLNDFDEADLQELAVAALLEDAPESADQQLGELLLRSDGTDGGDELAGIVGIEPAEPPVVPVISPQDPVELILRESPVAAARGRRQFAPLWGLAASLLLLFSTAAMTLLAATPQELNRLWPAPLWANVAASWRQQPVVDAAEKRPLAENRLLPDSAATVTPNELDPTQFTAADAVHSEQVVEELPLQAPLAEPATGRFVPAPDQLPPPVQPVQPVSAITGSQPLPSAGLPFDELAADGSSKIREISFSLRQQR